jgi:hypothetical protein
VGDISVSVIRIGKIARLLSALSMFAGLAACSGTFAPSSNARLEKAKALFAQRCQTAGEKIYRTVPNVEGVYLLKVRPKDKNYGNQFALDDPYGNDLGGDGYILTFLRGSDNPNYYHSVNRKEKSPYMGYLYVDVDNVVDGGRYRYTGKLEEPWLNDKHYAKGYIRFVMSSAPVSDPHPRYGVTYDDISTHEDREYWIAGSSLKVIDLLTNEIIAERVGYMMDWAQGSTAGARSPWLFAADNACPAFSPDGKHGSFFQSRQADRFVEKVLLPIPKQGN